MGVLPKQPIKPIDPAERSVCENCQAWRTKRRGEDYLGDCTTLRRRTEFDYVCPHWTKVDDAETGEL